MAAILAVKVQHDIHINLQSGKQRNQPVNREPGKAAMHKLRRIGLLETKLRCSLPLRESKGHDAKVHVLKDEMGVPLEDIRTATDSRAVADQITALVRRLTSDPTTLFNHTG